MADGGRRQGLGSRDPKMPNARIVSDPGTRVTINVSPLESSLSTAGPAPLQEALRSDCSPRTTAIFNSLRFDLRRLSLLSERVMPVYPTFM